MIRNRKVPPSFFRKRFSPLVFLGRMLTLLLILSAFAVLFAGYRFYQSRLKFPTGTIIAEIHLGGMSIEDGQRQLEAAYDQPIELRFKDNLVLLQPGEVDFEMNTKEMIARSLGQQEGQSIFDEFLDSLRGRQPQGLDIPLSASVSEAKLRAYLVDNFSTRYDIPAVPIQPDEEGQSFLAARSGEALDLEDALPRIVNALADPDSRIVQLSSISVAPPPFPVKELEPYILKIVAISGFDGLVAVYMVELNTGEELYHLTRQSEDLATETDAAFSASSIIKLPIMVSSFKRLSNLADPFRLALIEMLVTQPGNVHIDTVLQQMVDPLQAPLEVSRDMRDLGLENTFLAGYFAPGSPVLELYQTPANSRQDLDTDPDLYNQTAPRDVGKLLQAVYECSQTGDGILIEQFGEDISQEECELMLSYLERNKISALFEDGLPPEARFAHIYGWETIEGLMYTLGEAGIIYSPGSDYVLVVFLYHPVQIIWDVANRLISDISSLVYNFFEVR